MLVLLSPAKRLDFESIAPVDESLLAKPKFHTQAKTVVKDLQNLSSAKLKNLMGLSDKLADLNYERNQNFKFPHTPKNAKASAFTFQGDTYQGLQIGTFSKSEIKRANQKVRILSGLYGLLKPLDLIQPYRLEMGTAWGPAGKKDLYDFWKDKVTKELSEELKKEKILVNCASLEYFSAVDTQKISAKIITPQFKEWKNGQYKIISFNAKRARGMMAKFIVQNNVKDEKGILKFDLDGYRYNKELSNEDSPVFTRKNA